MTGERLGSTMLDGLAHEPVRVAGCRWISRVVTTDPPRYTPHTEYRWACELVGAVPLLAALLLEDGQGLHWGRSGRKSAATALGVGLSFLRYSWEKSDDILVNLSQHSFYESSATQVAVRDASLKRDPRGLVGLDLADDTVLQTGELIRVGIVNSTDGISAGLVVVAQADTESCRASRWRIKRRLHADLPTALSFLKAGRRAGVVPREGSGLFGVCRSDVPHDLET